MLKAIVGRLRTQELKNGKERPSGFISGLLAALTVLLWFPSGPLVSRCKLLWLAVFLSTSFQTFVSVVGFALSLITLSLVASLRQMCFSASSLPMTPKLQLSVKAFS